VKKNGYVMCPYCGGEIKRNAKACPHCGSDEQTGWSDQTYLDGIDIGDGFDYDETFAKEFSRGTNTVPWWKSWKTITGAILLALFLILILRYL
jgi:hypothetical protein